MEQECGFMVCVRCMTYNHASYIENTMNGFCMQETTFPFVCVIVDDSSTDGEQEVIREYLQEHFDMENESIVRNEETEDYYLTFAQHKKNKNCHFAVFFLKYNHYSIKKSKMPYIEEWTDCKYTALCEGDDWWTHSNKIQMQVDFLENHLDYVLCFGDAKRIDTDNQKMRGSINQLSRRQNKNETSSKEERFYRVLNGYYHIQTLTVLYRTNALKNRPQQKYSFMMGDTNLWLHLSQQGNFHYFEDTLGVYNLHQGSASHSMSSGARFALSMFEMRCYYCDEYGYAIPNSVKKRYNRALININMLQKEIATPIYKPFYINRLQWMVLSAILRKGRFYKFYRKIVFPIRRRLIFLESRINLAKRLILNRLM